MVNHLFQQRKVLLLRVFVCEICICVYVLEVRQSAAIELGKEEKFSKRLKGRIRPEIRPVIGRIDGRIVDGILKKFSSATASNPAWNPAGL